MRPIRLALLACTLLTFLAGASAEVIVPLVDFQGHDSGWDAVLTDNVYTGVFVDDVGTDFVLIEVAKTFYLPPRQGQFPANVIGFRQRLGDSATVRVIRIKDETIINLTGVPWTDYHWEINGSMAAFDRAATEASGFVTLPFSNWTWSQTGWLYYPASLDVDGGTVPPGSVFSPGVGDGNLVIQVDLSQDENIFWLTQYPTPEPAAVGLLGIGAVVLLLRRRRKA